MTEATLYDGTEICCVFASLLQKKSPCGHAEGDFVSGTALISFSYGR